MATENWKQHIFLHIGKLNLRKQKEVISGIVCVDTGLKSALLFDVTCVSSDKMQKFLHSVTNDGLVNNRLTVLEIDLDIFVVNLSVLKQRLQRKNPFKFVNVSGKLSSPVSLSVADAADLVHLISKGIFELETQGPDVQVVTYPEDVNRTSVFGVLLGYPVVYWYPPSDTLENCLSMEPLTVVKITASYINCYEVFSFSFPSCFMEAVRDAVNDFVKKVEEDLDSQHYFEDMHVDKDVVTLSSVAM